MPQGDFGRKQRRQWAPDARALSIVGDRWLMVIVRDLASGPLRLDTIRRSLPGVSAGALEARLVRMADEGIIVRRRHRSLPPRVDLELTERGRDLLAVIAELARWELRSQWSAPRADEWVDIGACFRLATLLQPSENHHKAAEGKLELAILDDAGKPIDHYAFIHSGGQATLEHRPAPTANAHLSGTEQAWIRSLSPTSDDSGLRITGDEQQANAFLELFKAQ